MVGTQQHSPVLSLPFGYHRVQDLHGLIEDKARERIRSEFHPGLGTGEGDGEVQGVGLLRGGGGNFGQKSHFQSVSVRVG